MGEGCAALAIACLISEWNPGHTLAGGILRVVSQCARERETANHNIDWRGGIKLTGISLRVGNGNLKPEMAALEGLTRNRHVVIIVTADQLVR